MAYAYVEVDKIHEMQRVAAAVVLHVANGNCRDGEALLRSAVADDPDMAAGVVHCLAHWTLRTRNRPDDDTSTDVEFAERLVAVANGPR